MAIPLYLAKTSWEFRQSPEQPDHLAWMACHFSPYGTGLTNLPATLPDNSLLILNDRTPVHGHDPKRIRDTVEEVIHQNNCFGILLDFQRPDCDETTKIVEELLTLPCPVCVSDCYAKNWDCPVFLPPVPLNMTVEAYLACWLGREVWLEVAAECASLTATRTGCVHSSIPTAGNFPFRDQELLCHYRIDATDESVQFILRRDKEDLNDLLIKAEERGVTKAVGLWQELKDYI